MGAKADFQRFYETSYPHLFSVTQNITISETLISPHKVQVPKTVLEEAQNFVSQIYKIRSSKNYVSEILGKYSLAEQPHFSALMSYDFHLLPDGLKLIEINTNASLSVFTEVLSQFHETSQSIDSGLTKILDSFEAEYELFNGKRDFAGKKLVIIDDKPSEIPTAFEFLQYKKLLQERGWNVSICDFRDLAFDGQALRLSSGEKVDFIYNRHTDFLFSQSPELKKAYEAKAVCFSPHPAEYVLTADKERLTQFSQEKFLKKFLDAEGAEAVKKSVGEVFALTFENHREIWAHRKKFFFKPFQSYGSKAVYNGESISRKVFDSIVGASYIAQTLYPPPMCTVTLEDGTPAEMKYDLRFYAYRDQVQLVGARLFRGQATNARTIGGGLAAVDFV